MLHGPAGHVYGGWCAVNRDEPVVEDLLPIAHTPRHARNIVTEACLRWDLAHLITPATLIVSELVSNVVEHARTMMTLTVALRGAHLYLAVYEGSSTPILIAIPGTWHLTDEDCSW